MGDSRADDHNLPDRRRVEGAEVKQILYCPPVLQEEVEEKMLKPEDNRTLPDPKAQEEGSAVKNRGRAVLRIFPLFFRRMTDRKKIQTEFSPHRNGRTVFSADQELQKPVNQGMTTEEGREVEGDVNMNYPDPG